MTDELDRFRTAWRKRTADPSFENEDDMKGLLQHVTRLDRQGLRRSAREVAIAIGAAATLAATLMWASEPWLRAYIVLLSATATMIAAWRCTALFRRRAHTNADTLVTFCRAELSRIDKEIRLQRTLAWWYLAPIFIGTNAYVFIVSGASLNMMMIFVPFSVVIVAAIAMATRRSLRRELLPLRVELNSCLTALKGEGDEADRVDPN